MIHAQFGMIKNLKEQKQSQGDKIYANENNTLLFCNGDFWFNETNEHLDRIKWLQCKKKLTE